MNVDSDLNGAQADALRQEMVGRVIAWRAQVHDRLSTDVEAALRTVPRHIFLPEVSLEKAYSADAVVTKRGADGRSVHLVSAPSVVAMMLDQLSVQPGHRVMEIGSGGYNAALLKELVGPGGEVTTIDIDPDVADRARAGLAAAGYEMVNVVGADGEDGCDTHAPYDRVIVTAGAWDIPPAWVDQLAEGGRLVVPLRVRGLTRSVVFERDGDHLTSRSYEVCGFVPMQGAGQYQERLVPVHGDEVVLRVDDGQPVEEDLLLGALSQPRVEVWSGVTLDKFEPFDQLELWLATAAPGFGVLKTQQAAVDQELVPRSLLWGASTVFDGASLAYRASRPTTPENTAHEFGAYAHGPDAARVASQFVEQIQTWDREHRYGARPTFAAYPAGTPDDQLPPGALVLNKRHTRVTILWP